MSDLRLGGVTALQNNALCAAQVGFLSSTASTAWDSPRPDLDKWHIYKCCVLGTLLLYPTYYTAIHSQLYLKMGHKDLLCIIDIHSIIFIRTFNMPCTDSLLIGHIKINGNLLRQREYLMSKIMYILDYVILKLLK